MLSSAWAPAWLGGKTGLDASQQSKVGRHNLEAKTLSPNGTSQDDFKMSSCVLARLNAKSVLARLDAKSVLARLDAKSVPR